MNAIEYASRRLFFGPKLTVRQKLTGSTLLGGVLALSIMIGVAWKASQARPTAALDSQPRLTPVTAIALEPIDSYRQHRTYTGVVRARRTTEMSFQRMARVANLSVDEGDRVAEGQVLGGLDLQQLHARRDEIEARRQQAQAQLAELVAGPRQETIAAARAAVQEFVAERDRLDSDHRRNQQLLSENAISKAEFERTQFGKRSAEARLEAARRQLEELEQGTRPEKIDSQRALVNQLDAGLAQIDVDFAHSRLIAPFDGVVAERYLDEGSVAAPGSAVLKLVETTHLEAWIGLPATVAGELELGQAAELLVAQRRHQATVHAISPTLDLATRTRTVILELAPESSKTVVPGQLVRVKLESKVSVSGFWLPTEALSRGTRGLWSAFAIEQDEEGRERVVRRDVEVLHTQATRALVRGTLQPGDRVITVGAHRVTVGQLVDSREERAALTSSIEG